MSSSPWRTCSVSPVDATRSDQLHGLQQNKNYQEQHHEAEVQGNSTEPEWPDVAPNDSQWRIRRRQDTHRQHQHDAARRPVPGEALNPADDPPSAEEQQ